MLELDSKQMYHKCVTVEQMQFHQFQEWIAREVKKIRFNNLFEKNKRKMADRRQLVQA